MTKRRVALTGVGIVCPVGLDAESAFDGLLSGRSGAARIGLFDPKDYTTQIAAELKDFEPTTWLDKKLARKIDRFSQIGLSAGLAAWKDSGLDMADLDPSRVGVIAGSGVGGLSSIEAQTMVLNERGPGRVTPFLITRLMMNALSGELSILLGAQGLNYVTASACASASHALGSALRAIQYGEADIVISGGSEASITPLGMAGFCSLRAMSKRNDDPVAASRPFDKDRDGFVMGEGAGVVVLETLEHAQRRGARIYCELVGYGSSTDAHHVTAPSPMGDGAARCMRAALASASIRPDEVAYINAHGTSTKANDVTETAAIRTIFGTHADTLAVSSTKSVTGHLLGAAGGLEAVATSMALHTGMVPPTANLTNPDPECDLDYVSEGERELNPRVALSNAFGFGGTNATLVFSRWEG